MKINHHSINSLNNEPVDDDNVAVVGKYEAVKKSPGDNGEYLKEFHEQFHCLFLSASMNS